MRKTYASAILCTALLMGCGTRRHSSINNPNVSRGTLEPEPTQETMPIEYSETTDSEFYRKLLNEDEDRMYNELLTGCRDFSNSINITPINTDSYMKVMRLFSLDHPEFYWTSYGNQYYSNQNGTVFKTQYNMKGNEQRNLDEMNSIVDDFIGSLPETDTYGKMKLIYEYIIDNTVYDPQSEENQDITSVLLNHRSVCAGYAKTFKFICDKMGINCLTVVGEARGNVFSGSHAWNMVEINGRHYWVDATWGDPIRDNGEQILSYEYLCVSDDKIADTHILDTSVNLKEQGVDFQVDYPACDDNSLEYYRQQNAFFDTYDREAIHDFIVDKITANEEITMQFANENALQDAMHDLFDESYIFTVLQDAGYNTLNINYSYSIDTNTLTIPLS